MFGDITYENAYVTYSHIRKLKCCQVAAMVQGRGTKVREHHKRSSTPAPLRAMKRVWKKSLSQGMHETREGVKDQD